LRVTLLGALFFGVVQARSTELSIDDALRLAREGFASACESGS